jgi:hypothetical protein
MDELETGPEQNPESTLPPPIEPSEEEKPDPGRQYQERINEGILGVMDPVEDEN